MGKDKKVNSFVSPQTGRDEKRNVFHVLPSLNILKGTLLFMPRERMKAKEE